MEERKVMFSISELKIKTAQFILGEAGITAFSIDKRDSAHAAAWGDIELYVDESKAAEARAILLEAGIL